MTERRRKRPSRLQLIKQSSWMVFVLAVTHELNCVFSFLHPVGLFQVKYKVPLLKNGENYSLFFRTEFDSMESQKVPVRTGEKESGSLRKLPSNKVQKRVRKKPSRELISKKRSRSPQVKDNARVRAETTQSLHTLGTTVDSATVAPVCRVVTLSDGKIPTSRSALPQTLFEPPYVLHKLDNIYHAMSHEETRRLEYMVKSPPTRIDDCKEEEEVKLVAVVRRALEDAGFQLLTRRDLDLCDSLNAGYLLRLSIIPDLTELDDGIAKEFYPEIFDNKAPAKKLEEFMFEGKVLVFWRGYSQEVSRGRLLLPKLDYLQASLVQHAVAWLKRKLGSAEHYFAKQLNRIIRTVKAFTMRGTRAAVEAAPNKSLTNDLQKIDLEPGRVSSGETFINLSRYGGSKTGFLGSPDPTNALNPFLIWERNEECDLNQPDESMYECLNHSDLRCPYDDNAMKAGKQLPPMQLLERVTVSNLVNPFTNEGRKSFFSSFFANSELVEPTYEEVLVIWRQKEDENQHLTRPVWTPPRLIYELADMYDFNGLPLPQDDIKPRKKMPLQIRTFDGVPMANLPAVMPKTKLVFRPADAFVFDLISLVSLVLVIGSQRFDSPRLDLLAIGSVCLWTIRLVMRYSNKMARYDLLVKRFLTSKISHRNAGALKYLVAEAGEQRAARAALVHAWLCRHEDDGGLDKATVLSQGMMQVNDLVRGKQVHVDIPAALNDLEDIGFVSRDGEKVRVARDHASIKERIKEAWNAVLDGNLTMQTLVGRGSSF